MLLRQPSYLAAVMLELHGPAKAKAHLRALKLKCIKGCRVRTLHYFKEVESAVEAQTPIYLESIERIAA